MPHYTGHLFFVSTILRINLSLYNNQKESNSYPCSLAM